MLAQGTYGRAELAFGHFGTLLYAAPDWVDKRLGIRSMELLSQKVLPTVNSAITRATTAA